MRKEAKKRGHKKPRKDPGVPNSAPFKEALLREAELRKQRVSAETGDELTHGVPADIFKLGPHGLPISFMTWTQLEELKQQQKLDRLKEQQKRRNLDTDTVVEPSDEPVKKVCSSHWGKDGFI